MEKVFKATAFFAAAVCVALALFVIIVVKISPAEEASEGQMVGDLIWYTAPDGGIGFRILQSKHPQYRVKIMMNSPDILYHEGIFEYQGIKLDHVRTV
ncbi:hypothetical protein [Salinivibrio kushneri]|uniref:hypothetical protein n=1 Tax=Salinivibrio kushneri TaxID=1908198 RepID=UPI0022B5C429|nr:hypothetical protein [Salinivibrio kushneri]WBA13448.1 hypothetical protein O4546_14050 [Salinivibrio kushneri]